MHTYLIHTYVINTYIHTHTYIHIHTYTHTQIHTFINIRIAKSYRTVSNEALCILTGLTPIAIKIEETIQFYEYIRGSTRKKTLVDSDMEVKYWHHPAETITFITEDNEETSRIEYSLMEASQNMG